MMFKALKIKATGEETEINQDKQPTLWNDLHPYGRKH